MHKPIVKISTPYDYKKHASQISPELSEKYQFEIDNDCDECDYWVVLGDLPLNSDKTKVNCPRENIFYLTDEAYVEKKFNKNFLNQFSHVITCRDDIMHVGLIRTHEMLVWQLNQSYEQICNISYPNKSKNISLVCSDKLFLPGHVKRYAFANKLMGHFKDKIDFLGSGFERIEDKLIALMPYKYSIAIENSALNDYFTEKITECYLTNTYPVYYGAPNIHKYFDERSLTVIDIDDYIGSIRKIEEVIESDLWSNNRQILELQKEKFLNEYHFFPALCRIISRNDTYSFKRRRNSISSMRSFQEFYYLRKKLSSIKRILK